ncbi:lysylphosphatidylglycerol synthase domain-containing protein, partial [Ideonella sp.]|uniref:lysylphosphatidylglycerol synthase domain-containing protein n=1 Tax=Ideonella sp. TaxID=1929293 RepID=UPI003BB5F453
GYPDAWAMQVTLALLALYSALSRFKHADATAAAGPLAPAADAAVSRIVMPCLLAGVLLSALLQGMAWQPLRAAMAGLPAHVWGLALLGLWGSYALRAERLRREWQTWGRAQRPGAPMPGWLASVDLFLAHNAALVLLPMRAGEAGYPWLLHRRFGIPVADAVRSLVWLRLQDAAVLGLLGLLLLLPGPGWWRALAFAAGLLLMMLGLPWLSAQAGARWPRWQSLASTLTAHRADRLGWMLCVANWCLKLLVLGGLLMMLAPLTLQQGWGAAVAGELAAALPLQAPAGLGSYEAAIWAAGQWLGASAAPAELTAAALAVHGLSLASALLTFALFRALDWLCRGLMSALRPH